jgi:hypothetical protein
MNRIVLVAAAVIAVTGCKKEKAAEGVEAAAPTTTAAAPMAALKVESVTLGKAVGDNKQVVAALNTFAPTDTIFASVKTDGTAENVNLKAKWVLKGEAGETVINEGEQKVTTQGVAYTVFQISKPEGLTAGNYKLDIYKDDAVATTGEFSITPAAKTGATN